MIPRGWCWFEMNFRKVKATMRWFLMTVGYSIIDGRPKLEASKANVRVTNQSQTDELSLLEVSRGLIFQLLASRVELEQI